MSPLALGAFSSTVYTEPARTHKRLKVAHDQANLRQLIEGLSRTVHASGGVVRDLQSLGVGVTLPQRMRANQQYYTQGEYVLASFVLGELYLHGVSSVMSDAASRRRSTDGTVNSS